MARYPIALLATFCLASWPAYAQDEQVKRGPVPDWVKQSELMPVPESASGPAFMRRQDVLIHLDEEGQAEFLGYRYKILHPNALQAGNISISWNPASGAPVVHTIKILRDDETIDVLETAKFEILRREDQLEAARLDGTLTAVLRVADLRVGDELEVALTTRTNDPTLGSNSSGILMLVPSPPPGRFQLGLSWSEGQKPTIKMTPDMAAVAKESKQAVNFRFDNPPTVTPPKDAPPRYHWTRIVEYSDFADWAAISRHFGSLYTGAATLVEASPLNREVDRITAAHSRQIARASAALKLVQQDVRYIYVGLDGKNLTPATAEETWQRRYGDCKGKTALLLALLDRLGVDAEPVLVSNAGADDGLDERLPNPGAFDHVIVRARIDGVDYFMDGTLPPVVPPSLRPILPYRWILPLTAKGSSLERLDWQPVDRPDEVHLFEIDARAGFDTPAKITSTTILRGIVGLEQQVQFSSFTPDQLQNAFSEAMVGDIWQAIDNVQWRYDLEAQASVLSISGMGLVEWDDDGDGARSYALPGGGFSPPEKRVRAAGQDQNLPFYNKPDFDCRVTTVRLPTNTRSGQWSSKKGFNTHMFGKNYYRAFELRDGAIRMIRGLRVERQEIDAATAKADNERISTFDNSMAWIFFHPTGYDDPVPSGTNVPATYEIDWTADNVPCLAPDRGN